MGPSTFRPSRTQIARRRNLQNQILRIAAGVAILAVSATGFSRWWNRTTPAQIKEGETLFSHRWTEHDPLAAGGDGLGPVFNAHSCVECHSQGGTGGAGDSRFNVSAFTALPTLARRTLETGVVHAFSLLPSQQESQQILRTLYPVFIPPPPPPGHCGYQGPSSFDPLRLATINTPSLFGSGLIDDLSDWAIRGAAVSRSLGNAKRELSFDFKSVPTGRVRILPNGKVGKFGWKGQFATLEEFTAAACAMELGLSNPLKKQPVPREHRTDEDAQYDMTRAQVIALVRYVKQLPQPEVLVSSANSPLAAEGESEFRAIGCAECHTPDLGALKGVYSDFCLYDLDGQSGNGGGYDDDNPPVPLPSDAPRLAEWKTPPLWGVADSAPYMHDGSAGTLAAAIGNHGGAAKSVRERFNNLPESKQKAILAFLGSLKAPRSAATH